MYLIYMYGYPEQYCNLYDPARLPILLQYIVEQACMLHVVNISDVGKPCICYIGILQNPTFLFKLIEAHEA